jgi:hypothetical protein
LTKRIERGRVFVTPSLIYLLDINAREVTSEASKRSAAERLRPLEHDRAPAPFAGRWADPAGGAPISSLKE